MTNEVQQLLGVGKVSLSEMKPFEVELIAGLSPEMQRLWRRRGFLERTDVRRVSFDALEVAAILTAVPLAKHGHSPAVGLEAGRKYQHRVFQLALLEVDGAIELMGAIDKVEKFADLFSGASAFPLTAYLAGNENGEQATLLRSIDGLPLEGVVNQPELDTATGELATLTIDLVEAGRRLGNRIGRPLIRIDFPSVAEAVAPNSRRVLESKHKIKNISSKWIGGKT